MVENFFRTNILPLIGDDVDSVIVFLKNKVLIKRTLSCDYCSVPMIWRPYRKTKDSFVWKCENKACAKYKTTKLIRVNLFFEGSRVELQMIIFAMYFWSEGSQHTRTARFTGFSKNTASSVYAFLRSICSKYFVKYLIQLGGLGTTCQIDESLFTHKQKYRRGRISGHQRWVFDIVDTSFSLSRGYMEIVKRRDKNTLLPIIERVCLLGTKIYSDQWSAYHDISDLGFEHETVNHSENFVNPRNGVHTQHIESCGVNTN